MIQRRLLTRFKDKTPAPLANLDVLLEGTYRQVGVMLKCLRGVQHIYGLFETITEPKQSVYSKVSSCSIAFKALLLRISSSFQVA